MGTKIKRSFIFNVDWQEVLMEYPPEVRLEVYDAVIRYAASGTLSELKPLAKMAFSFIKKEIDYNNEKYNETVSKRREAGKKGMLSRYGNKGDVTNLTNVTSDNKTNTSHQTVTNVTDNDNVNDNDSSLRGSEEPLCGSPPHAEPINYHGLIDFFNSETKGVFGYVRYPLSDKRKGMINARIKEHGKQGFADMIHKACASDFLRGQNKNNFKATFDWLIKPTNFEKVISGNYDNRSSKNSGTNSASDDDEGLMRHIAAGIARGMYERQQRTNGGEPVSG